MGITLPWQWYRFLRDLEGKFVIASWLYSLLCGGLSFLSQVSCQTILADNSQQFIWGSIPLLLVMESQNPLLPPNCRFLLIRQIRLQASQVVNCVTWPNILDVLSARGLMPSGAYQIRTPCECHFDTKRAFHKVFTRYSPWKCDFCSEKEGQVNEH